MKPTTRDYQDVREEIRDADLLLFRASSWAGRRLLTTAGRSAYSHAGMAAWWKGRLMCLETLQFRGGRAVLLSNVVSRWPGIVDVYRVEPHASEFDPGAAVQAMIGITGRPYGWASLLQTAFVHLPVIRMFRRPSLDDQSGNGLPYCSQAVSRAYREGGLDPVPNLADRFTEPGDLGRSLCFRYRFTLQDNPRPN